LTRTLEREYKQARAEIQNEKTHEAKMGLSLSNKVISLGKNYILRVKTLVASYSVKK
jgi:hypothetical protein